MNVRGDWEAGLILTSAKPLMILGGGPSEASDLRNPPVPLGGIVALDGAADRLLEAGIGPAAVLGDLDSVSASAREAFADRLHHFTEQDTTDFEKALMHVEAPAFLGLGLTGGRLDHALSVLNTMARHRGRTVVLADAEDASALVPASGLALDLPPGTRLSLMPLGAARVTTTGLRWPLERAALAPDALASPSNEVDGSGRVRVSAEGPVLAVLPRAQLPALWRAVVPAR